MGPSDSLSLPSEPPEVENWFSSYVYESPELNTGDDFEGCHSIDTEGKKDGYEGEESGEAKEENLEGNRVFGKRDGLFGGENVVSTGFVRCRNADGEKQSESKVLDLSDTLSLSSEPPDITNWFSSYVYQSPALETSDDFTFSEHRESKFCTEVYNAGQGSKGKDDILRESRSTEKKNELIANDKNFGKFQNNHEVDGKRSSPIRNYSPFKTIYEQNLEGKSANNYNDDSVKDVEKSSLNTNDLTEELEKKFTQEASHILQINRRLGNNGVKSPRKLVPGRDSTKERSGVEVQTDVEILLHRSKLDLIVTNGDRKRATGNIGKENDENDFAESGFVSTRASRRVKEDNLLKRPFGVKSEFLRNEATVSSSGNKDAMTRRKVLSETTNFQCSEKSEITGKWRCPQKSKPSLGPPLKQLRLEQWVHRM